MRYKRWTPLTVLAGWGQLLYYRDKRDSPQNKIVECILPGTSPVSAPSPAFPNLQFTQGLKKSFFLLSRTNPISSTFFIQTAFLCYTVVCMSAWHLLPFELRRKSPLLFSFSNFRFKSHAKKVAENAKVRVSRAEALEICFQSSRR